jgi:uncharacterized protein involved in exopolysaccharide biosynthesis
MNLEDRQSFSFGFFYTLSRRWLMMLATFVAILALFMFAGYLITPTWEAEVLLLAEQQPQAISPLGGSNVPPPNSDAAENLSQFLGGKGIATDMVKKFRLDERTRIKAQEPPTLRDWCKITIVNVVMSPITLLEWLGLKEKGEVDWVDKTVEDFREGLFLATEDIEALEDSNVVSLKINGETPQLATDIANEMVKRAREILVETTARSSQEVRDAQRRQLQRVAEQRATAEAALKALQEEQGGVTLSDEARANTLKLQELTAEDSRRQGEIELLRNQLEQAARDPSRYLDINSDAIAKSGVIQNLRSSLHAKEVQLAAAVVEKTESHPDVVNIMQEIASLRDALANEIRQVHRGLVTDRGDTQAEMESIQRRLLTLPARELAEAQLELSVETYRKLYQDLLKAAEEMEVLANANVVALDFKVLDYAYVSPQHSSDMPSWLVVLMVGMGVGLATAVALPLFVEYWRDPIKGPGDLRRENIEVLGVVPRVSSAVRVPSR